MKEYTEWQQLDSVYENLKAAFCEGLRGRIGGTVPSWGIAHRFGNSIQAWIDQDKCAYDSGTMN